MPPREPWNALRAAFRLICFVVGVQVAAVLLVVGGCMAFVFDHPDKIGTCREARDTLAALLTAALAAALAMSTAYSNRRRDDDDKQE